MIGIKFIKEIYRYRNYIIYAVKSDLKAQVSNTMLGYLWWLLDPLLNMLIYTLLVTFIFQKNIPNFPVFVYCALLPWKWATATFSSSAKCIRANIGILNNVQMPIFILPLVHTIVNFIKYLFGLIVLFGLVLVFRIPLTIHIVEIIPVIVVNFIFIFGFALIFTHIGVIIKDFNNTLSHILRVWFYLSPGMYALEGISSSYRNIWWFNPMTTIFISYREVVMYGRNPLYKGLMIWFIIGIVIIWLGLNTLYKNTGSYGKEA